MKQGQNVNVNANGRGFIKPQMKMKMFNNDNVRGSKYDDSKNVDRIADKLVEKFGNAQYRGFYCKVAWKLSEARIWYNYESAVKSASSKGRHPGPLFTYLCKRDGV